MCAILYAVIGSETASIERDRYSYQIFPIARDAWERWDVARETYDRYSHVSRWWEHSGNNTFNGILEDIWNTLGGLPYARIIYDQIEGCAWIQKRTRFQQFPSSITQGTLGIEVACIEHAIEPGWICCCFVGEPIHRSSDLYEDLILLALPIFDTWSQLTSMLQSNQRILIEIDADYGHETI